MNRIARAYLLSLNKYSLNVFENGRGITVLGPPKVLGERKTSVPFRSRTSSLRDSGLSLSGGNRLDGTSESARYSGDGGLGTNGGGGFR
jgi:hypothetical protein